MNPSHVEAHNNLGNTLKERGGLEEAESSYRQAIALNPRYAGAHYNLGITLQELGRLEDAVDSYNTAEWLDPDLDCKMSIAAGIVRGVLVVTWDAHLVPAGAGQFRRRVDNCAAF